MKPLSRSNPAMPVLSRPDGVVQVGWDPRRAVLVRPPSGLTTAALADLLRVLQAGATLAEVQALADGVDASVIADLIAALVDSGVVATMTPPRDAPARRRSAFTAGARCRICWPVRCDARAPGSSRATCATPPSRPNHRPGRAVGFTCGRSADAARAARREGSLICRCGFATAQVWSGRWSCPASPVACDAPTSIAVTGTAAGPRSPRSCVTPSAVPTGPPCWPPRRLRSTRSTASSRPCTHGVELGRAPQPPSTLDTTLEFDVNTGSTVARRWTRHPRCSC